MRAAEALVDLEVSLDLWEVAVVEERAAVVVWLLVLEGEVALQAGVQEVEVWWTERLMAVDQRTAAPPARKRGTWWERAVEESRQVCWSAAMCAAQTAPTVGSSDRPHC